MQASILAREAELRALKAQIDPHFLFNSLHSISALTTSDAAKAREMCVLLSDFLRSRLKMGDRLQILLAFLKSRVELVDQQPVLFLRRLRQQRRLRLRRELRTTRRRPPCRGGRGGRKWTHGTRPVGTPEPRGVSQSAPPALSEDHGEPAGLGTTLPPRPAPTRGFLLFHPPCSWFSLRLSQRLCVSAGNSSSCTVPASPG